MIRATLNEAVTLQMLAADGSTGLFCRVTLYKSDNSVLTTKSLPHIAEGLYGTTHTFTSEDFIGAVYQFFTDAEFTTPAAYDKEGETIEINSDKVNILRILGLKHQNALLDQTIYDSVRGGLETARLRVYDTKANADAAFAGGPGTTGLQFEYAIQGEYDTDGILTKYKVSKEL